MFLSSLLELWDLSNSEISTEQLEEAAASVPPPPNDEFGECLLWVLHVVQRLNEMGLVNLTNVDELGRKFEDFVAGNKVYATTQKFPIFQSKKWVFKVLDHLSYSGAYKLWHCHGKPSWPVPVAIWSSSMRMVYSVVKLMCLSNLCKPLWTVSGNGWHIPSLRMTFGSEWWFQLILSLR